MSDVCNVFNISNSWIDNRELIWENQNLRAEYDDDEINIEIDLTPYKILEVVGVKSSSSKLYNTITLINDSTIPYSYVMGTRLSDRLHRYVTITDSGLSFSPTDDIGNRVDGTYCIPYRIYGIR